MPKEQFIEQLLLLYPGFPNPDVVYDVVTGHATEVMKDKTAWWAMEKLKKDKTALELHGKRDN